MLTLPNINSPNSPLSSPVSRPVLVADSVRPTSPLPAIEPTTAVSRERSRTEGKVPEGIVKGGPNASGQAVARSSVRDTSVRETLVDRAPPGRPTAPNAQDPKDKLQGPTPPKQVKEQPPSEKTAVQKALETQVKSLLSDIWKASATAVNFLLGREEPTAVQLAVSAEPLSAIQQSLSGRKPFAGATPPSASGSSNSPSGGAGVYSVLGSDDTTSSKSRGQLLDVVA